jgi:hypothetical protein
MVFAGRCCVVDPFFALRESFSLCGLFRSAPRTPCDRSEEKVVRGRSFSILYRHGAQLFIDLPEQRDVGISTRQRDPHLAYCDADQRADL